MNKDNHKLILNTHSNSTNTQSFQDLIPENSNLSRKEWSQERQNLLKKISDLEKELKYIKKQIPIQNINEKLLTIPIKNHKRVGSDKLKLNENKLAKIRFHFMKKKQNSEDLPKENAEKKIRRKTYSFGGVCSNSRKKNIFDSYQNTKRSDLGSFHLTMYNNINVTNNNHNNCIQSTYFSISPSKNQNTLSFSKESQSNTQETVINTQLKSSEEKFFLSKNDEFRGSFSSNFNRNEDEFKNLRISVAENSKVTKKDPFKPSYNPIIVLKTHFDSVRDMFITPDSKYIASVGEDMMVNVWDFKKSFYQNKEYFEPYISLRGHSEPILCITGNEKKMDNYGHSIYTAGSKGIIRHWKIPEGVSDKYDLGMFEIATKSFSLPWKAHDDAIWQLNHHPNENIIASIGSDGNVKLWQGFDIDMFENKYESNMMTNSRLLKNFVFKNYNYNLTEIPTSCTFSSHQSTDLIVSYVSPFIRIYDIETGKANCELSFNVDKNEAFELHQINKITHHKNSGLIIVGNEDRQIKFFDRSQGKCIKSMVAHTDSVSSVTSSLDEYQILSCSHDGSYRSWDIRKFKLLYDIPAHRKKNDEGVLSIKANDHYQVVVTSGADGLIKIFKN